MSKLTMGDFNVGDKFYYINTFENLRILELVYKERTVEDGEDTIRVDVIDDDEFIRLSFHPSMEVYKTRKKAQKELDLMKEMEVERVAETYSNLEYAISYLFGIAEDSPEDYAWELAGLKRSLKKHGIPIEDGAFLLKEDDQQLYYIEIIQHEFEGYRQYIVKDTDDGNLYTNYVWEVRREKEGMQKKFTLAEIKALDEEHGTNYLAFKKRVEEVEEKTKTSTD